MKTRKSPRPQRKSAEALYRSEFAGRLKQATEEHEIGDLASKIGVTPATLYRWLNGKFDPSLPKLAQLADAMKVSLAWLVTGTGPIDSRQALRHALLENYGTTDFEAAGGKAEKPPIAFHEPWLFELLYGPPNESTLFGATDMNTPLLMEVREDSMEPTIAKGDLLLIDRAFGVRPTSLERAQEEQRSAHDGIHAFRAQSLGDGAKPSTGLLVVRRIQYRLDGKMAIRCDNPKYPEEIYTLEARNRPAPIGRVVWRGGRV
jgi:phage repressor protein C with HTH and peptisase S24 domain